MVYYQQENKQMNRISCFRATSPLHLPSLTPASRPLGAQGLLGGRCQTRRVVPMTRAGTAALGVTGQACVGIRGSCSFFSSSWPVLGPLG